VHTLYSRSMFFNLLFSTDSFLFCAFTRFVMRSASVFVCCTNNSDRQSFCVAKRSEHKHRQRVGFNISLRQPCPLR